MSKQNKPTLHPSSIAQFYKLQQCPMYLYHQYVNEDFGEISDLQLSPLLSATGEAFEASQLDYLLDADIHSVGPEGHQRSFDANWTKGQSNEQQIVECINQLVNRNEKDSIVFFQPTISGVIGSWPVQGDADIVIATSDGGKKEPQAVKIRIAEIKSSSSVKTHHQLQAAIYALLFEKITSDVSIDISASIVTQDPERNGLSDIITSTNNVNLHRLHTFELETRENDIRLLLEESGKIDQYLLRDGELRDTDNQPRYRIDNRCDECSKQAKCLTHAVAHKDLSLLGLTEGVQESLHSMGIETIRDIATLYEWPVDSEERGATSHATPTPRNPELVTRILRETEISNLLDIAQIAHRFLREIDPEYEAQWESQGATAGPWSDYLIGSGRNLPNDNPPQNFDLAYPRKSLVRIYPYVQYDFVRNRLVLLAAKVTSDRYEEDNSDGIFIISHPKELPNQDESKKNVEERRIIADFFRQLSEAIDEVRPNLSDEGYSDTEGFLHIYPYSNSQRDTLMDAVKRHTDSTAARAIRVLLGYREDIDQETVSVLRDEFRSRHALRYPGLGIIQTAAQFYSNFSNFSWEETRDGSQTQLKEVFAQDFFETTVPYTEAGDRVILQFRDGLQTPSDRMNGYYPIVGRHQDSLPLEYVYACKEFDILKPKLADDPEMESRINRYRYHTDKKSKRISLEDIGDCVQAICNAYEHIERSIREKDSSMTKKPIELADLTDNTLGVSELQSTCLEYQELEFGATRRSRESQYRKSLSQRVATGQAIPFEVDTPPIEAPDDAGDDDGREWVGGSLLRSLGGDSEDGIQPDTPLSLEQGNFVVMTPLVRNEDGSLTEAINSPTRIKNQVLGRLTRVDTEAGEVRVSLRSSSHRKKRKFRPNHTGWTNDEDDEYDRQYVDEGMKFVLDAAIDDFVAHRASHALRYAAENDVHNRLVNLYDEGQENALRVTEPLYDSDSVESLVRAFDEVMPESTNADQRAFVSRLNHTVAALQGPPGTGKTAYASAPAILSRAYAEQNGSFAAIASAHSHTAVDELAENVGKVQEQLSEKGMLQDAKLIRIRPSGVSGKFPDNVDEYAVYNHRDELESLFEEHVLSDGGAAPLIVFTTPVTLRNMVNSVRWVIDEEADTAEEFMTDGRARLFDYLLIDEASMMDLPLLFLTGAFLKRDSQLMLIGDHRQMQPIQSHDWEGEDRQTIEEHTPSVSALDFIRYLRGDNDNKFEQFDREPPVWSDKDAVLPLDQLRTSYRLPPAMAQFETELFYHRDNITLNSGSPAHCIPDVRSDVTRDWVATALDPDTRVTLLLHDDTTFTKDSPVEAYLANQLFDPLPVVPKNPDDDQLSAGVVVPFRLMRRRLENTLTLSVDTVERFQGGERDVMALAMTAGNQGYINQLTEFLLDANRFNVGASRMKRKLFLISSKSIFQAIGSNPQKYEDQKAWKQLYQQMVAGVNPDSSTVITSAEVPELGSDPVTTQVYTGYED